MSRRIALRLTGVLLLAGSGTPLVAQEFSAMLVHQKPEGAAPAKVFVRGDNMRFEVGKDQKSSVMVLDLKQRTGFMAISLNNSYTELQPERIRMPMPFFHPANPDNACPAWEKLVNKPGTCAKIGNETVGGRSAVRYKGVTQNGDTGSAWVDRKLNFVIKWEGQAGAAELQKISEGPQPASLFLVPKGYGKVDSMAARQASKEGTGKAKVPARKPQK